MLTIIDKSQCCGCWACMNICPKSCIEMDMDEEGFHYPRINLDLCIDCGLCEKVCPILTPIKDSRIPKSFVIQNKDNKIRRNSTSGGFYMAIAEYVISNKGVVFGAAFGKDMVLRHSYSETLEGCLKFRGSKYVQSLIGCTYSQVKTFLGQGRLVAFSGTPCQIVGLLNYLRKGYDNLITIDLVCRGTPSPLLLRKYLDFYALKFKSIPVSYLSRDKFYGYDYSTATIEFKNKSISYHKGKDSDLMLRFYFKNLSSRPSCYNCHFKTLHRVSDMTIFDCWDAPSVSHIFDDKGATNVFIHTEKGISVFESLKSSFVWAPSDIESVIRRDGCMIKEHVQQNPLRKNFFIDLHYLSLDVLEKKYLGTSIWRTIVPIIKPLLYKIGIFSLYMQLKNYLKK